jgi:hypothetical protein
VALTGPKIIGLSACSKHEWWRAPDFSGLQLPQKESAMTANTKLRDASEKTRLTNRKTLRTNAKARKKPAAVAKSARNDNAKRTTKAASMLTLLQRKTGASIPEQMQASGWQAHSVRGFLSGTVGKREDLALTSEATDAGRRYRIKLVGQSKA